MSCRVPLFVAVFLGTLTSTFVGAQTRATEPQRVRQQAAAATLSGEIRGVVHDQAGAGIGGATIVAMGAALATVRSDQAGRFTLALSPGEYILRATRDGYVSTYREAVRVQSSTLLERTITLVRQGAGIAVTNGPATVVADAQPPDHGHDELAWKLRHLPPTVLRDVGPDGVTSGSGAASFKSRSSFIDWALDESARAANFITKTEFTGQVNYLTLSSLTAGGGWWQMPDLWSGRIATIAVGAPIGSYGDWQIRGAMSSGDVPSWTFAGEYKARGTRDHAFTAGLSFSSQALAAGPATAAIAPGDGRRVGSAYGGDRWRLTSRVDLEYGLRFDRYDYVTEPELLSPRIAARVNPVGRTFVRVSMARRTIAPGADEFLPPPDSALWLPPQRTFSPLVGFDLRAERVDSYGLAVEQEFGQANRASTIVVRRFYQQSADQMATIFGLDRKGGAGHYYVSTLGDVDLDGWGFGVAGWLAPHLRGSVDYSISDARWDRGVDRAFLERVAPSSARSAIERIHDLSATLETNLAPTSTGIAVSVRLNSAFSRVETRHARPIADGRFDLSVHQPLPYQPFRGGRLEMVFGLRTLSRDLAEVGSVYDELLTTAPPMRVTGGVRVRF